MSNLSPSFETVNLDDLCSFFEANGKAANLNPTTARLVATSVRNLAENLTEDEPHTVKFFEENLDVLSTRWRYKNQGKKTDTLQTYVSRARSALRDYKRFLDDPTRFRFENREATSRDKKNSPKPPSKLQSDPVVEAPIQQAGVSLDREYGGFRFSLPEDGFTSADGLKFALHILSFASDFNPMNPWNFNVATTGEIITQPKASK